MKLYFVPIDLFVWQTRTLEIDCFRPVIARLDNAYMFSGPGLVPAFIKHMYRWPFIFLILFFNSFLSNIRSVCRGFCFFSAFVGLQILIKHIFAIVCTQDVCFYCNTITTLFYISFVKLFCDLLNYLLNTKKISSEGKK